VTLYDEDNKLALSEPNIRDGESATYFTAHLTISDLKENTDYTVYKWDDISEYPTDSNFEESLWIDKQGFNSGNNSEITIEQTEMKVRSDK